MIITTIALWLITLILIVTNREKSILWGSSVAFFGGLGSFQVVLQENIVPFINSSYNVPETTNTVLSIIVCVCSGISHYFVPYSMLMFGVVSAKILATKWEKRLAIIALIPMIVTLSFFPTHYYYIKSVPENITKYYQMLSMWAVPYITVCNTLFLVSYLKEKKASLKKHKLLTCIFVIPFFTCIMLSNFLLRGFGIQQGWRYNVVIIVVQFICFMYFTYKYGILGIRLKFEKERLDSTIKAMTSGTAILNHSIKNEIYKISMCMKNIRNSVYKNKFDIENVDGNIQTVLDSTNHLTAMMKRIQDQMKEIILMESNVDLAEIVSKSVEMQKYCLGNITVVKNYSQGFIVKCDQIHITEVLNNIIRNAVEAIAKNGRLEISIYSKGKGVVIEVQDNGIGISEENIKYVFDPFFSTKRLTINFGLGMSYAYNVMQHHKGNLEIQSKENIGTNVLLIFPKDRILTVSRR
jgi:two-component system sporulation sensor kinase B